MHSENKSFSSFMYNLFAEHLQIDWIMQDWFWYQWSLLQTDSDVIYPLRIEYKA